MCACVCVCVCVCCVCVCICVHDKYQHIDVGFRTFSVDSDGIYYAHKSAHICSMLHILSHALHYVCWLAERANA